MQMNLSTRQLRAFLSLVTERNFTRAAAATHLSQPAFSALIAQMEAAIGFRLFDRSTRNVRLSAEGEAFEPAARRVLGEMEAAFAAVTARAELRRGRVTVALLPSLAADWLPPVLARFREGHPGIEVQVVDVLSDACIDAVRSGRADFALAATRAETDELKADSFCSDRFYLVCPIDHPLADARQVRPQDLAAWPFIHLSRTSSVRQYIDASTHPAVLPAIMEVDQLATVAGMVAAGLGISVVPALSLYQFRSPALRVRKLPWPSLRRSIYLVRRRDRALSLAGSALCDWLRANRPKPDAAPKKPGGH